MNDILPYVALFGGVLLLLALTSAMSRMGRAADRIMALEQRVRRLEDRAGLHTEAEPAQPSTPRRGRLGRRGSAR